jgi:thiamine pyrophosphokinase
MTTSALIANGHIDSLTTVRPAILHHQRVVAVDGGLHHCHELGIIPHLIVGDFDSCSANLLKHYGTVPQIVLAQDKDQTDLEVAIEHEFKQGAREISLFAAWGKRMDHSLTNALLLVRHAGRIKLATEEETLFAIQGTTQISCHPGQTLSLLPIYGQATGINSSGLKWELKQGTLDQNFIGISNICMKEQITISIAQGSLLCCLLHGKG